MANVEGTFYSATTQRRGVTPVSPPNSVDDPVDPVNPPIGSHPPITIGTPANGLSIVPSSQVLSIGLASSGVTGALSGTDWSTFNRKIGGTIDLQSVGIGRIAHSNDLNTITGSTRFVFDFINGNVGIGVSPPAGKLDMAQTVDSTIGGLIIRSVNFTAAAISRLNTGVVTLRNGGVDRHVLDNGAGQFWINTTSGTNTLDVNGTTRVRTIANAVSTEVLVPSATGVINKRTLTEFKADLGLTSASTGTGANTQVAYWTGTNTQSGDNEFTYNPTTNALSFQRGSILQSSLFSASSLNIRANQFNFLVLSAIDNTTATEYPILVSAGNSIDLYTANSLKWSITLAGILQSNGAQTIQTSTGNLTLATAAGNGSIILSPHGTGNVLIGTTTDSGDKLRVNGTVRIDTINNLGTSATSVLVPSATGVVSLRTLAELASDGLGSKWTDVTGGIFRNGAVAIGRNTIPAGTTFSVSSVTTSDGQIFFLVENNAGVSRIQSTNNGLINLNGGPTAGNNGGVTVRGIVASTDGVNSIFRVYSNDNAEQFRIVGSGQAFFVSPFLYVGNPTIPSGNAGMHVRGVSTSTDRIFTVMNNSNIIAFRVLGNLTSQFSGNLQIEGGSNIVLSTTTGTRIGTATNQLLSFWNKTPIAQPTTAIVAGAFVANTSGIANDTATFGGYTMGQVVQALRNTGLLA